LTDLGDGNFELDFGKRGKRTGFKDENGNATSTIYLKHDKESIIWHRSGGKVSRGDVRGETANKLVLDFVIKWQVVTLGFLKSYAKNTEGLACNDVGSVAEGLRREGKIHQHLIKITGKSGPAETVFSTYEDIQEAAVELNARFKKAEKNKDRDSHDSHGANLL
jgi:hypothetical protein